MLNIIISTSGKVTECIWKRNINILFKKPEIKESANRKYISDSTALKHKQETANELREASGWYVKSMDERVHCYKDKVFFFKFLPIYNGYKLTKYGFKSRTEAAISSAGIDLK